MVLALYLGGYCTTYLGVIFKVASFEGLISYAKSVISENLKNIITLPEHIALDQQVMKV